MSDNILAPVAALQLPDSAALTTRAERALAFVTAFQIQNDEDYSFAADELRGIKARAKANEEARTRITVPLNAVLKAVNALFAGPGDLLAKGETILKTKMLAYDDEQRRVAAEERRAAEALAAAERQRLAEAAAARQAEADAQAKAAAEAQAKGDEQAAAVAIAAAQRAAAEAQSSTLQAQMVLAPVVVAPVATAKGISTSSKLEFDLHSMALLLQHIATGTDAPLKHPELLPLITADSVRLRAYVRGLGLACALPGVHVTEGRVMSARAAA